LRRGRLRRRRRRLGRREPRKPSERECLRREWNRRRSTIGLPAWLHVGS
jgi:hypothetical protein